MPRKNLGARAWTISAGRRAGRVCQVRDARDEEEAFFALKAIKKRAKGEIDARTKEAKRAKITLPKLKFMD